MRLTQDMRERMGRIRLLLFDVDGVLTDGRVILGGPGPVDPETPGSAAWNDASRHLEFKLFDIKDGMGISLARRCGLETGILTGRISAAVDVRGRELRFTEVIQGEGDKTPAFEALLLRRGLVAGEVAYMGDDLQDLPVLLRVGLASAPADAHPEVRKRVHAVTRAPGGRGAVRELIEAVLKAQGKWAGIVSDYTRGPTTDPNWRSSA